MAPVITKDRPDSRFFIAIMQHDDGNWSAEPMPLDDATTTITHGRTISMPGLRSISQGFVNSFAQQFILTFAPLWYQNDCLFILTTQTSGDDWTRAHEVFTWIGAVRNFSNILNDQVSVMTFEQLVVFVVPGANWPPPPEYLQATPPPAPAMAPAPAAAPAPMAFSAEVPGSGEAAARAGKRHRPLGFGL